MIPPGADLLKREVRQIDRFIVIAHTHINMYREPCGDKQFGQLTLFSALALLRDSSEMTLILIVLA